MLKFRLDEKTELRLLDLSDAGAIFALVDRNRDHLRAWLPWVDDTQSIGDTRAFLQKSIDDFAVNRNPQCGLWYRGDLAGIVGLHPIDWANRKCEIGYWLGKEFEDKGLMTLACRVLIDHIFNELALNRVGILCAAGNHRSRAIPERLGFRYEGTQRRGERLYDHYVDLQVYSMLREEWHCEPRSY